MIVRDLKRRRFFLLCSWMKLYFSILYEPEAKQININRYIFFRNENPQTKCNADYGQAKTNETKRKIKLKVHNKTVQCPICKFMFGTTQQCMRCINYTIHKDVFHYINQFVKLFSLCSWLFVNFVWFYYFFLDLYLNAFGKRLPRNALEKC